MNSGICWVSEMFKSAGGQDVFPDLATKDKARDRLVTSEQVIAAAPDVITARSCGKKVRPEKIAARPGWASIPAVLNERIHEIKSPLLQPGPATLTDGLDTILAVLSSATVEA